MDSEIKTEIKTDRKITITLTEREARWLKGVVQNPIGCDRGEEDHEESEMRKRFWDALSEIKAF